MHSKSSSSYPLALILATFSLSLFAGIILSLVIQQWFFSNFELIKKIQAKEEEVILENTLNKYNF
ncbi:hypothetical protein HYT02_04725 [Candidatus Gottesmanbacteria bacterium]|nr:hypothetical protein [Candidatus Gottesmanbacteria bacterium]